MLHSKLPPKQNHKNPGYPSVPPNPSIPAYRIMSSSLGGLGMFATRKIIQGELILSERALVVVPLRMPPMVHPEGLQLLKDFSIEDRLALYFGSVEIHMQTLLDRRTDEERHAYMSLHANVRKDRSGHLNNILRTNCFAIAPLRKEGDNGAPGTFGTFTGVFLQLSRINHSCGPSASCRFHMPSFSMRLYAHRDIAQGEEITVSYDERVWESAVSRQQDLDSYGFRCSCPSCANAAESDRRRARIEVRYNTESVNKRNVAIKLMPKGKGTNDILLKDIDEGLRLFAEEGLETHSYYMTLLWYVCSVLNAIGTDEARFSKYCYALIRVYIADGFDLGELVSVFQLVVVPLHRLHYLS
ncbi:SET domain-containing protein [Hymenopellis radicata]|nr:SET domain-containing protein [Hymenopellis radicata]